ncbi:uncharacterized protein LOC132789022 [Drosophila nasuta]|uniref:uncharacterized protein LOC132789022 n=1 Tax=Drosophila nasuta TaxID=42062 RepID=UPI00295EABD4|nr:uncharacterized protein LOC132789022 [Drosophila nasuta]XP_060652737.1 uncharacterized protein LOC132789022 [Drosophila nasuta]
MPLSQGCYMKPSVATKRALKALRKENQQQMQLQLQQQQQQQHQQQQQQQQQLHQGNAATRSSTHTLHALLQSLSNNQLELSLLLGESFVRYGNLPQAFDAYEMIASRQPDGHVPLDKLAALASALTALVRQFGIGRPTTPTTTMPTTTSTRYQQHSAKQQHMDDWPMGLDLSADVASDLLELHAPTRELCVPSPTDSDDYDPLLCPLCRDMLRGPVTTNCGHTFCGQCCETITQCNICLVKFPRSAERMPQAAVALTSTSSSSPATTPTSSIGVNSNNYNNNNYNTIASALSPQSTFPFELGPRFALNAAPTTVTTTTVASTTATATTTMASTSSASALAGGYALGVSTAMKFMPDVLVRRLVEKWWGPELLAKKIIERAASCMHLNRLDDALKFCNASLEKAPSNFKSLCLRAEVLLKLSHFQSSLADIENALKTRCTSPKAHYLKALALSGLGRLEEALFNGFLAICLDKNTNLSNSEIFQHDLAKILQRLLAQTPKSRGAIESLAPSMGQQHRSYAAAKAPYVLLWEQTRRRRKQPHHHLHRSLHHHHRHHHMHFDDVEDEFGLGCDQHYDNYIMADEEDEEEVDEDSSHLDMDGDFLFPSALDYIDQHNVYEQLHSAKQFELQARRHTNRKPCRRKWPTLQASQSSLDSAAFESRRCSRLLSGVLERTQHELQRLRKLDESGQHQVTAVSGQLIDASDFDCVLCCRTLWKPVVTPCGHTYCLVCLDRCMDYNSSCPLCMSPLVELNVNTNQNNNNNTNTINNNNMSNNNQNNNNQNTHSNSNLYQGSSSASSPVSFALAKRPVTITKFIEAAMKRFIPDHYEARFRQEIDLEPSVPVFICTAAFPSVPCPLIVCDPRYRLMVRRALESGDKTFGIVQPNGGKSRYYDIGTILDIRDCVLLGDGCSILSTIGCKRFKILARSEKDGYETAKVEYICDEPIEHDQVKSLATMQALVLAKATGWFDSLSSAQKHEILQSYGKMPPLEHSWELTTDGPAWAWWIIALLPLSQQLKVDILATTSLRKRLRAIEKMLDWLRQPQHVHQQHHQQLQSPQTQSQQTHDLSLDCEEQEAVDEDQAANDECCLYAEPHTDEELLV